jgi:hypothetical protein
MNRFTDRLYGGRHSCHKKSEKPIVGTIDLGGFSIFKQQKLRNESGILVFS